MDFKAEGKLFTPPSSVKCPFWDSMIIFALNLRLNNSAFSEGTKGSLSEKIATILTHQNPNLKATVTNGTADRPKISLHKIKEVSFLKFFAKKSRTGFTFYSEDAE